MINLLTWRNLIRGTIPGQWISGKQGPRKETNGDDGSEPVMFRCPDIIISGEK
ncbi:MAG: hypothetical protein ACE5EM_04195 [Sphingomonadales bacterium]